MMPCAWPCLACRSPICFTLPCGLRWPDQNWPLFGARAHPGVANGVLLQVINPKAYAVNTALFTGFAFFQENLIWETVIKLAIMNALWIPVHVLWLWAGKRLRELDLPEGTHRVINYAMAVSMVLVVVLALISQVNGV